MSIRRFTISLAAMGLMIFAVTVAHAEDEDTVPISGRELMTEQERDQYRTAMQALETEEERAALRKSHQKEMKSRAREQGVELRDGGGRMGHGNKGAAAGDEGRHRGRDLMTKEEHKQQREKMRSATSAEERKRRRNENHDKMKQRARERGEELPDKPNPSGGPDKVRGQGRGRAR